MLTLIGLIALICVCRRPLAWIGLRLIAFAVGFVVGWRWMERR